MPPQNQILPAIIASNQKELEIMLKRVPFAENLMLDLMDGQFVKGKSLDFKIKLPIDHRYQLHIMAVNPINRIKSVPPEVDTVILHAETLKNIEEAINQAKKQDLDLFIALNPETPASVVRPYLDQLDGVLIMTVNPGQYGAKFLPKQLEKVKKLRKQSKEINIEVDGGMKVETMPLAVDAGANIIASGSYIMKNSEPETAYKSLYKLFK